MGVEKFINQYSQEIVEIAKNVDEVDRNMLIYPEYEKKFNDIKTKLTSFRSKVIMWQQAPLEGEDFTKREQIISKLGNIITNFKKLDPKNFAKQTVKEIDVTTHSGFKDIPLTKEQITSMQCAQFLAYNNKGFEFYLVSIGGIRYFLRINKSNPDNEVVLSQTSVESSDIEGYITAIQGAELIRDFQDIELKGSRGIATIGFNKDVTTTAFTKLGLTRRLDLISSWTQKDNPSYFEKTKKQK